MREIIPPDEYISKFYMKDFAIFGGDMLCGFTLTNAMSSPKRESFRALTEFVLCQFELNLLNQFLHTHFPGACAEWSSFIDKKLLFRLSGHVPVGLA